MKVFIQVCIIFLAALVASCASVEKNDSNTSGINRTSVVTDKDKITRKCLMMLQIAEAYQTKIKNTDSKDDAWVQSSKDVYPGDNKVAFEQLLIVGANLYKPMIDKFPGKSPRVAGFLALTQCLAIETRKNMLPTNDESDVSNINSLLNSCEASSATDDDLGACILESLSSVIQDKSVDWDNTMKVYQSRMEGLSNKVRAAAPDGIEIQSISQVKNGVVRKDTLIVDGMSEGNKLLSLFMHNIESSNIGKPRLQLIEYIGKNVSYFELDIIVSNVQLWPD